MNIFTKKLLPFGLLLLLNGCIHHPYHHSYYPNNASYRSGYVVQEKSYYRGTPGHYDDHYHSHDYDQGRGHSSHHHGRGHDRDDD